MAVGDSYRVLAEEYARLAEAEADPAKRAELEKLSGEYKRLAALAGHKGRE